MNVESKAFEEEPLKAYFSGTFRLLSFQLSVGLRMLLLAIKFDNKKVTSISTYSVEYGTHSVDSMLSLKPML